MAEVTVSAPVANRCDRMEIAGAFGSLRGDGIFRMDTFGVLLAFGLAMIVCGLVYRTPIPVQAMKGRRCESTTQAALGRCLARLESATTFHCVQL